MTNHIDRHRFNPPERWAHFLLVLIATVGILLGFSLMAPANGPEQPVVPHVSD